MAAAFVCALLVLAPVSHSQASYAVLDSFGAPNGEGAGQLSSNVADVAVNRSGAGGAAAGDVYVADLVNGRIQQLDSEGNPIRVFGWNVVASGPDNVTPASAVQSVSVPASVTGGTFTLTFNGKTTAPLPFDATAAEVEAALGELGSIRKSQFNSNKPNVAVSGGPGASAPYSISFRADLAQTPVPLFGADSSNLVGGSVSVSMTTPGVSGFEVCDVEAHPTDVCQAGEPFADPGVVTAAGQLFEPKGIAIDQATGTVYVSGVNNRIEAFSATGAVEGAFGWGVIDGSRELQLCTAPCLPGFGGRTSGTAFIDSGGAGQISSEFGVGQLDVGPSGILYLASPTNRRIDEFEPILSGGALTGIKFLRAFGWDVVESGPDNVPAVTARQLLTIPPSVTGGTFKLSFEGATTSDLAYNVAQKGLFGAVNNLASIKAVEQAFVEVEAKGLGEWEFIFRGSLEDMPLPQIVVDSAKLAGGAASITVLAEGVSPYEVCDVVAHPGELCQRGRAGGHDGQFGDGRALDVAVDSSGTVYALDSSGVDCGRLKFPCRVQEFGTDGAFHGQVAPSVVASEPSNTPVVAADNAPLGIAVDRETDHLLVAKRNGTPTSYKILELDADGNLLSTSPTGGEIPNGATIGIAAGSAGSLYAVARDPDGAEVWLLGPAPAPTATIGAVSAIGATSATFNGTVTPPAPGLAGGYGTFYHFEYSVDGSTWTRVPAEEDVALGDGTGSGDPDECPLEDPPSCNVSQTVGGLQPAATYQVRLVASTGTPFTTAPVQFTTDPAPPTISATVAEEVLQGSATLTARLNPNNEETTYRFEWGTTTAYGNEAPAGGASAGSGGEAIEVSAPIAGLAPHTAYHFRLLASNGSGTSVGPDQEFFTLNAAGLPENRGAELVSPPDKGAHGRVAAILTAQLDFQAAEDGDSFYYPILNGLPDSTAGGEVRYLGRRSPSGWASTQVTAPALITPLGRGGETFTSQVKYFSPDLGCGLLTSSQPLSADTPAADVELGVTNIYRFNADGTYTLITNTVPINPTARTEYGPIAGASRDCSTVYFSSNPGFNTEPYEFLPGASTLYEWREGTLADAGILPDGTVAEGALIGGRLRYAAPTAVNVTNSISEDGSRLFFTATSNEGADKGEDAVFVRIDGAETVDVSQSQTATAPTGARYELASPDGSHVFFAANYGLTPASSSGPTGSCATQPAAPTTVSACDLYDFDTETRTLTNVSADVNPADTMGAAVAGVLDVSKDGSTVYFAAFGQLLPGEGRSFEKNLAGGFVNVYRSHEGTLSFVATAARQDLGGLLARSGGDQTSQTTPDGRHLLFATRAKVTGYDSGGVLEAYRYSADSGATVCVSCRLDGAPSLGDPRSHRGIPPLGPIASPYHGTPAESYLPRSISEDGRRVFFSSMDDLAPGAASGNEEQNVYEWVGGQVYLLGRDQGGLGSEVEYLDSSASGEDVFIRTTAQLDPRDIDFTYDVYDLRVGGGFPAPPPPPVPCVPAEDECQGPLTAPPGASAPASAGFAGPGNAAPRRSCKRGRRLRKGRCVRRARHHRKARHNRRAGRSR